MSLGQILYQFLELETTRSFVQRITDDPKKVFTDCNIIPVDGPGGECKLETKIFMLHHSTEASGFQNLFKALDLNDDNLRCIFDLCRKGLLVKVNT